MHFVQSGEKEQSSDGRASKREAGGDFWRTHDLCGVGLQSSHGAAGPRAWATPHPQTQLNTGPKGCQPAKVHVGPEGGSNSLMFPQCLD